MLFKNLIPHHHTEEGVIRNGGKLNKTGVKSSQSDKRSVGGPDMFYEVALHKIFIQKGSATFAFRNFIASISQSGEYFQMAVNLLNRSKIFYNETPSRLDTLEAIFFLQLPVTV